jgi:hypothetical protein
MEHKEGGRDGGIGDGGGDSERYYFVRGKEKNVHVLKLPSNAVVRVKERLQWDKTLGLKEVTR